MFRWIGADTLIATGLFACAFSVYGYTLAPTLTWRNNGADGGDLISAAANFGVPHPPGYPTYVLLARLFLLLPFGDEAHRLNLMSAFCAAAAIALFYWLMVGVNPRASLWINRLSAAGAAWWLAFSPLVWSQATISEVYTLNLFFIVAICVALQHWRTHQRMSSACGVGLLLGLGLGNHLTLLLIVPGIVALAPPFAHPRQVRGAGRQTGFSRHAQTGRRVWEAIGVMSAGLLLGLSVYLYLPIASHVSAHLNWGRLDSLTALMAFVGGAIYRGYLFGLPLQEAPRRVLAFVAMLFSEFQVWGVALALAGGVALFRDDRRWAFATGTLALGSLLFAIGYNTSDSFYYLMPFWFVMAFWLAVGLRALLTAISDWQRGQWLARGLALALLTLMIGTAAWRLPSLDLSGDHEAEQFALQTLGALPTRAILLSETDRQTFALWYYTQVRRVRSDVVVIDRNLFAYDPYRAQLRAQWGNLTIPKEGTVNAFISTNGGANRIFALDAQSHVRELNGEAAYAAH